MVPAICQARARLSSLDVAAPGTEFSRPETRVRIRHIPSAGDRMAKITRRIGRANAACSHKVSVTRDLGGGVVADAVQFEPVSTREFPANRENNREFRRVRALGAILIAGTRVNSKACRKIPYSAEQGIISAEQGILVQEQGIFPGPNPKSSPDQVFGTHRAGSN